MDFWNLPTLFITLIKTHGYGLLSYNVLVLCVWNFGILDELYLRNEKYIEWMECNFNLLCYGLLKIPEIVIIFKSFLNIIIWIWKWKKMLLSISSKYSYFKPFSTTIKKDFEKGF